MAFGEIIERFQVFLLIFVRIFAMLRISPLFSSGAIPRIARIGLTLFCAVLVLPTIPVESYPIPDEGLQYVMLILGEAMLGIITGFFLVIIYAAFLVAGQFFSLQMGFGASQVFDPLAQIQIPLLGQFLNIMAMVVFVTSGGFQKIFYVGVQKSFEAVRAYDFIAGRDYLLRTIFGGLGGLFEQALAISFPVLGTLLLVSVTMGLLAKAAPQMNLLMLGFPLAITVAFLVLFLTLPFIMETFSRIIDSSFEGILRVFGRLQEASS